MPARHRAELVPPGAESERGLSAAAVAYRRAEPYVAASSTLMGSVALFTALGYALGRWMGHTVPWLLVTGAVFGMGVGFIGFFTRVLRADADAKRLRSATPASRPREVTARPPAAAGRGDAMRVIHLQGTSGTGHAVPRCGVWGSTDTDWTAEGSGVTCVACGDALRASARASRARDLGCSPAARGGGER
jgi:F0F1-type ATP synthase assembly protein I